MSSPRRSRPAVRPGRHHRRLHQLQDQRIRLSQYFLDRLDAEGLAAHTRDRTADLIDTIIEKYPTAPHFASLMVDRLLAGQDGLEDALRDEVLL